MPTTVTEEQVGGHSPAIPGEQRPGLNELVQSLLSTWRRLAHARLSLFAVELRSASLNLVFIVGLAAVVAFLLGTSWLLVLALIGYLAIESGMQWGGAGLLLLVINLAVAGGLVWAMASASEKLTFAATRRTLQDG